MHEKVPEVADPDASHARPPMARGIRSVFGRQPVKDAGRPRGKRPGAAAVSRSQDAASKVGVRRVVPFAGPGINDQRVALRDRDRAH